MSSELKTNKISPATGTALQISDSGDTTTIPSGATLDIASGATIDATGATITGWPASADNTPAFQMTNTANQTFSAGSYGTLDFNQTNWDTDSGCDLTNNKYVVPSGKSGKYFIYGYFGPTSLSGSSVYLRIKVNTTEVTLWNATAGNSGHHRRPVFIVYDLAAGDEIIWQLYVDNVSTTTGAQSGGGFRLAGV
jgi:hypothetical protein